MNLGGMVYIILVIWRTLKSTKEGKKVKVLCTLVWNHERSVVVLDHFRNFKGIYLVDSACNIENGEKLTYSGKGNYCSKLKTGKLKTKILLKISILDEQEPSLQNQSRQNQRSANVKLRKICILFTKTWKLAPSQQLYLKINSGFHARENASEATISESSQIRELHEMINFWMKKSRSVMLHSAKVHLCFNHAAYIKHWRIDHLVHKKV